MAEEAKLSVFRAEDPPRVNELRRFLKVFLGRPVVIVGVIIIFVLLVCAAFPKQLAPYDPNEHDLTKHLLRPSLDNPLGTDALGRDLLSRIIFGARTAIIIGFFALSIASVLGMILGLTAGYFGSLTYTIIMRFIDALMVFPPILLALTIAGMFGGGMKIVIIALGVSLMPGYARVMCGLTLSIREEDYILATRSAGASSARIMLRHILPNAFPPMIVLMTLMIGIALLSEAGLSFLGIGITEPTVAWGTMVNDGYKYLLQRPVFSIAPGVAIILVVFAFNMVGDGIRDAIDPRLRGTF